MMGWVRGIREVREVTIAVDVDPVGLRRGPVVTKQERVIIDLPAETWARLVEYHDSVPPERTGAGPCGTQASGRYNDPSVARNVYWGCSPFAWSIGHLVAPLRAYYAAYVPPMRFGAKPGPRGRRAA